MNPRVMADASSAIIPMRRSAGGRKTNEINGLGPEVNAPAGPAGGSGHAARGPGRAGGDRSQ